MTCVKGTLANFIPLENQQRDKYRLIQSVELETFLEGGTLRAPAETPSIPTGLIFFKLPTVIKNSHISWRSKHIINVIITTFSTFFKTSTCVDGPPALLAKLTFFC